MDLLILNEDLFFSIYNLSNKNNLVDFIMTTGAEYVIFAMAIVSVLLFLKGSEKDKKAFFLILGSFIVGFVLLKLLHIFIYEPRPYMTFPIDPLINLGIDESFPSDHSLVSSIMTFSYYFYRARFAFLMGVGSLWIGFSRIFSGVHYPFDILGGFILGLLAVSLAWYLKGKIKFVI